jgi:hypothetical protein
MSSFVVVLTVGVRRIFLEIRLEINLLDQTLMIEVLGAFMYFITTMVNPKTS